MPLLFFPNNLISVPSLLEFLNRNINSIKQCTKQWAIFTMLLHGINRLFIAFLLHSRKHPYHSHKGNWKLTPPPPPPPPPLPPSDVLIHFSSLPLLSTRNFLHGGVWIFSRTTQWPSFHVVTSLTFCAHRVNPLSRNAPQCALLIFLLV
jgi:hypothetical protein